jgi:ABC-2 type transport system ATP-binding protein
MMARLIVIRWSERAGTHLSQKEQKSMIEMKGISKTYRVRRREAGLGNALKSLVSRDYTDIPALRDMSFTVPDGQILGYIGPNGAGKSTTIKILSGILRPDRGECTVDGLVPWEDRKRHVARLGVVFGQRSQLWWDVPVMESFDLLRDIYRVPAAEFRENLDRLTALLDLGDLLKTPARMLSLGQRMRCEIAAALLHGPKILFLDEPTIGLDAVSKLKVREFILEQNRLCGTTVLLTTHDMQDIDALCSRVLLIGKGQLLLDGDTAQIRAMAGENLSTEESVADLYRRFGI